MKKMTCKEFKEALDNAGMYFDVWGWEGILNMLSAYNGYTAREALGLNCDVAARHDQKISDKMYETLAARGYYND